MSTVLKVALTSATGPGGPHGGFAIAPQVGQLRVGETEPLGPPPVPSVHSRRRTHRLEPRPFPADTVYLVKEPGVDAAFVVEPFALAPPGAVRPPGGTAGLAWPPTPGL